MKNNCLDTQSLCTGSFVEYTHRRVLKNSHEPSFLVHFITNKLIIRVDGSALIAEWSKAF